MNSNFIDDEQFNNNTWDEYSEQLVCQSPVLLGHPYLKKYNDENELSAIHLQLQSDTLEEQYSEEFDHLFLKDVPIQKKISKKTKKTSNKNKKKSTGSINTIVNSVVSEVNSPGENTVQQIQYCQQMRKLIDNLEGILSSIKQELLNQYQKKQSMNQ